MPSSLASRNDSLALAAAMSRHPAAGARSAASTARGPAPTGTASFATVAALLTGPWRVNHPVPFAAGMRAAPAGGPPPPDDDSWVVVVVGDGRGGVAGIGRAPLPADPRRPSSRGSGPGPRPPAKLALGALRDRLVGPARVAEGLASAPSGPPA